MLMYCGRPNLRPLLCVPVSAQAGFSKALNCAKTVLLQPSAHHLAQLLVSASLRSYPFYGSLAGNNWTTVSDDGSLAYGHIRCFSMIVNC